MLKRLCRHPYHPALAAKHHFQVILRDAEGRRQRTAQMLARDLKGQNLATV
jgi:hypothetical protein